MGTEEAIEAAHPLKVNTMFGDVPGATAGTSRNPTLKPAYQDAAACGMLVCKYYTH